MEKNMINSDNLSQDVSTTNPLKLAVFLLLAKKPSNASRNNTKNNRGMPTRKRCFCKAKYTKIEKIEITKILCLVKFLSFRKELESYP
jgi:hypothetical protein